MSPNKYETSHICAAVVACVAIVCVVVIALNGLVSFEVGKMTDWISVLISGGALVVSVFALYYLKRTFEATRGQLDVAANEIRPWVDPDGEVEVTYYQPHVDWVQLSVIVNNVGNSPAHGVHLAVAQARSIQAINSDSVVLLTERLETSDVALFPKQRVAVSAIFKSKFEPLDDCLFKISVRYFQLYAGQRIQRQTTFIAMKTSGGEKSGSFIFRNGMLAT